MTSPPQDNANALDTSPGRVAHLVQDLTSRYDDLLEFLLEFTHRQAQWDQRQQQLVDFQRRAIEQLRSTSFELVERHQQLQSAYPVLRQDADSDISGRAEGGAGESRSTARAGDLSTEQWPKALREKAAKLDEYEEELKQRIFEQKQLTQLTRLQRRKLAQQLRAQRAELERFERTRSSNPSAAPSIPDLTPFFEQLQKDLDEERSISRRSVDALQQTLDQTQQEKKSLQDQLKDRIADIDELKRLVVEREREGRSNQRESSHANEEQLKRLQETRQELEQRAHELDQLEQRTRLQRQKIAQTLRAQRAEQRQHHADVDEQGASPRQEAVASIDPEALHRIQETISARLDQQIEMIEQRFVDAQEGQASSRLEAVASIDPEALSRLQEAVSKRLDQQMEMIEQRFADIRDGQASASQDGAFSVDPELLNQLQEAITERLDRQMELIEQSLAAPPSETGASSDDVEKATAVIQQLRDELLEQISTKHSEIVTLLNDAPAASEQVPSWMDELREQIASHHKKAEASLGALEDRIAVAGDLGDDKSRKELNDLRNHLRETEADVSRLMDENAELARQLDEARDAAEPEAISRPSTSANTDAELDRLQSELEQALEQNRSLKKQLAESGRNAPSAVSEGLDWESAKRRLLAELEAFDDNDPDQKKERLTIEDVINETDRVIAEKDEEIVELKHLLSHQSESIGEVAVGASAIAELMDHDELIQQERESLRQLQEEWKEKLRTTEVELSLERARLARERAELEERISQLSEGGPPPESSGKNAGNNRGKWLERLGLRDEAE